MELINEKPWKWWKAFGARYYPDLAFVAMRVLSKQVGVGAVERSHKKMKNGVFSKSRPNLSAKKASVECYINCNVPEIDRIEVDEPLWLETYDELDDSGVVPDAETQQ